MLRQSGSEKALIHSSVIECPPGSRTVLGSRGTAVSEESPPLTVLAFYHVRLFGAVINTVTKNHDGKRLDGPGVGHGHSLGRGTQGGRPAGR